MLAIFFALLSLVCAAVNDIVFKLYANNERPVGYYLSFIGVIWALFFLLLAGPGSVSDISAVTLQWGIISGLFSALANILLIEAMARHEVGICATIYRLNLAPAALVAFIFLGENASFWKIIGIASAIGAVLLFSRRSANEVPGKNTMALWLVVIAGLLRAGMGITYKWGLGCGGSMYMILAINGALWFVCGLLYNFLVEKRNAMLSWNTCGFALCSGFLVCGIVIFLMFSLEKGDASSVLPISQLSFFATALIGIFFLREKLTRKKVLGLLLAVLCIFFMAIAEG